MGENAPSEQDATPVKDPAGHGRARRIAAKVAAAVVAVTLLALFVGSRDGGEVPSDSGGVDASAPEAASDGSADYTGAARLSSSNASTDAAALTDGAAFEESANTGSPISQVTPLEDRAVVRTGSLTLTSDGVADARGQVLNTVTSLGGYVADEESVADDDGGLRRTDLRLMVPTAEFDEAMQRAAAAGTVVGRTQSARDVTEQVVDIKTRVASAEASLRRIRLLLGRAVSLGDVIRLEQVLSSRQADLESLLAQQESLAAKTELATLQVTITLPPKVEQPTIEEDDEATGFLAGLSRGWDALASGYVTLATVFGTALPTLLVVGLLALIGRWIARRFRRAPVSASSAA